MDDHGTDIPLQHRNRPWGDAPLARTPRQGGWGTVAFISVLALTIALVATTLLAVFWVTFGLPGAHIVGWAFPVIATATGVKLTLRLT